MLKEKNKKKKKRKKKVQWIKCRINVEKKIVSPLFIITVTLFFSTLTLHFIHWTSSACVQVLSSINYIHIDKISKKLQSTQLTIHIIKSNKKIIQWFDLGPIWLGADLICYDWPICCIVSILKFSLLKQTSYPLLSDSL